MGIRITSTESKTAIYDSVSGFAFGPVFDSDLEAEEFIEFAEKRLNKDLRTATDRELEEVYSAFLAAKDMTINGRI